MMSTRPDDVEKGGAVTEPMAEDEQVPGWCGYFSPEEYSAFQEAVLDASCFGVDDLETDGGSSWHPSATASSSP
ncbi:hypothetical protein KO481_29885 [Nocardia sp. NEAU-G5]|uniref:Uncharacterized protein n=1 Tax=Nocardia albiluteola TaxID=2842303 RepID=A0ABS6B8J3_9NOCA|nr:hypothetical protein [Nocardia albiluteola]MBU3065725.1 hypothetical protein [Nocardia albiluteola]